MRVCGGEVHGVPGEQGFLMLMAALPAALSCPPHSHYEACSYGCPLSCGDLPVPGGCGFDCKEGCVCDEGFVLNGESCVPLPSCGCVYQGTYHPPGQTFHPGSGCHSLCRCEEGGLVSCEPSSCGPHEACKPSGGVLGCVAVGSATCQASGDPHYTTFDGRRFDFMGTCVYTLAQTCGTRPGLAQFAVLQENVAWGNGKVSVTRAITVQVANFTLRLEQRQRKVTVRAGVGREGKGPGLEGDLWVEHVQHSGQGQGAQSSEQTWEAWGPQGEEVPVRAYSAEPRREEALGTETFSHVAQSPPPCPLIIPSGLLSHPFHSIFPSLLVPAFIRVLLH